MIKKIESLGTQLDGLSLAYDEAAVQRDIDHSVAGTRQNVAASIAKGKRRRIGKCVGVEKMLRAALAVRQIDRYARNHIGPIRCAGIGEVGGIVHRVERRAVLEGESAAELPALENRLPDRRRW